MPTAEDFLYDNAPLVEVIAELRWDIQPVESLPNAAIDPHYKTFDEEISSMLASDGFGTIESLVPANIPIELLANRVLKRFRPQPNEWPVFQIGPGLFTVNIVPPYNGWVAFRKVLADGLVYLFNSYPIPDRYLHFRRFELKYVNAFTERHDFKEMRSFLSRYMNIELLLPDQLWAQARDDENPLLKAEVTLPLRNQEDSHGIIRLAPGKAHNQDAAVLELVIQRVGSLHDQAAIANWMDLAHTNVRSWFQILTNEQMKQRMGPMRKVEMT